MKEEDLQVLLLNLGSVLAVLQQENLSECIAKYIANEYSEETLKLLNIEIEKFIENKSNYQRFFLFNDENETRIFRRYIYSFEKGFKESNPIILINRIDPDMGMLKDNPIRNLELVYNNYNKREEDFELIRQYVI